MQVGIFWVPILAASIVMLWWALAGYLSGRFRENFETGGVIAIVGLLLFVIIHISITELISIFAPRLLSSTIQSGIEVLIYLPLLASIILFSDKLSVKTPEHTVSDIIRKMEKVNGSVLKAEAILKGVVEQLGARSDLSEELRQELRSIYEGIGEDVNSIKGSLESVVSDEVKRLKDEQINVRDDIVERIGNQISGIENYQAGQSRQTISAQIFESMGFDEVINYESGNNPDHVLRNGGRTVAAVETRHRKVERSTTLRRRDFKSGVDYAEEHKVPLIINWQNPATERLWLKVVEPKEIEEKGEDWKITVPQWVWHITLTDEEEDERLKSLRRSMKRVLELAGYS